MGETPAPVALCPLQVSHPLARVRNPAPHLLWIRDIEIFNSYLREKQIPVAYFCSRLAAVIVGSNPAAGMCACLL